VRPLPWLAIAGDGAARLALGPRWNGLRLLAVGPAIASAADGVLVTVAAGMASLAVYLAFVIATRPIVSLPGSRSQVMTEAAIAGVTAACSLASMVRRRQEAELSQARELADITQRVLLRPVPRQAGPLRLAAWYRSASTGARVGGDLYEVVSTPRHVRLVIGDVEGKGLPALQTAASVLGVFREAAHEEDSLGAIAGRIDASLARQSDEGQFATAVLAQVSPDGRRVELLNCGHPPPLLLGPARPRFIDPGTTGLPLGLAALGAGPRILVMIPFAPGEDILFYTDGISEARNKTGEFFPLSESPALRGPPDPDTLIERLSNEVTRYVGHAPDDDAALLLIARPPPPPPALPLRQESPPPDAVITDCGDDRQPSTRWRRTGHPGTNRYRARRRAVPSDSPAGPRVLSVPGQSRSSARRHTPGSGRRVIGAPL
jgi:serine phosphatase RsbU (regulator of sigma subunit)